MRVGFKWWGAVQFLWVIRSPWIEAQGTKNFEEIEGKSQVEARLTFVTVLLLYELMFFVVLVVWSRPKQNGRKVVIWAMWPYRMFAISIGMLGLIYTLAAFWGLGNANPAFNNQCQASVNEDIGGASIRVVFWVQQLVLILSALTGTAHTENAGTQVAGAWLLITHIAFSISLLAEIYLRKLSVVDVAIGSMIIDAQNSSLSIQLSMKHALSARTQVVAVLLGQSIGLTTVAILMDHFNRGEILVAENCECFGFFWWAWLRNCSPTQSETAVFWTYYGFRIIYFAHGCYFCLQHSFEFHKSKSDSNGSKPSDWLKRPTTIDFTFIIGAIFGLTSMAAAEIVIRDYKLDQVSQKYTITQITAIVIAATTAVWAIRMLLKRIPSGDNSS